MAEIIVDDHVIKFNSILAFGCSYTAGWETRDHEIMNITDEECDEIKRASEGPQSFIRLMLGVDIHGISYTGSYIKFLADHFGVEWKNYAFAGSSLDFSVYEIERLRNENKITDNDLIVVGLPCPNRLFYLKESEHDTPIQLQMSTQHAWPTEDFYHTYATEIGSGKNLIWRYYQQLQHLLMLNEKLNNRIIMLPMSNSFAEWAEWLDPKEDWTKRINEINFSVPFKFDVIDKFHKSTDTDCHGFLHPKLHHHEEFAKKIHEHLTRDCV